jgi:hypothetical protein
MYFCRFRTTCVHPSVHGHHCSRSPHLLNYSLAQDPFIQYTKLKKDNSTVGGVKFLRGDPQKDGILVIPDKFSKSLFMANNNYNCFVVFDHRELMFCSYEFSCCHFV